MRILTLDIETTPNLAHVWGLWQQNVGLNQLLEAGEVLCLAAKWYDSTEVEFYAAWDGREQMIRGAHDLLTEADAVVHYNGNAFDIPHLNREFLLADLEPPMPAKQIDLLATVKKRFQFPSNKLAYVTEALGLGGKANTGGHETWVGCMAGDPKAQRRMRKYNVQDVRITEALYTRLLPWIEGHPHVGLHDGNDTSCPNCGGEHLQRRGYAYTPTRRFQQYQCQDCGKWIRSSRSINGVVTQGAL